MALQITVTFVGGISESHLLTDEKKHAYGRCGEVFEINNDQGRFTYPLRNLLKWAVQEVTPPPAKE